MTERLNREVAILNSALELPDRERPAYVERACAGNAKLRAQVETLLEAHADSEGFLGVPAAGLEFRRRAAVENALTEKPGDWIGRYRLLQQIGEGGCGVVYMAEQEEPVRRRVALKVIKLGMDTKQVIARFEAERQALALMDHPNIAKVLDAGATETGRPYFVMELVRGVKITDFCDENKLSTADRLKLFIQVCQAVQHAHQKGVIHRDIKPSNVLVTINDPGSPGVPKVIDFGIAKATQGRLTDKTLFTAFEQFIGTPAYMSPEQAVMTSLDVDTRSDIYSLGVLLYELLTSKTPFDEKELLAAGLDEMRRTILEKEPPKPSTRLSTMLDAERTTTANQRQMESPKLVNLVRGDLDWIVMKALEKDRARRYETANGLAADIQGHLQNEPVGARPPSTAYRFHKAFQRNKGVFAAAAAIAVILVTGVIVSTSQAIRARHAEREQIRLRQQAQANERKAQVESAKSDQVARFLKSMLLGASPYGELPLDLDRTALREIVDRTAARVGTDLKGQPEVEAEMRQTLAVTYNGLGEWNKAEAMTREALRLRISVFGETNKIVASSIACLAFILSYENRHAEAETYGRKGLAMTRTVCGNQSPEMADALDRMAELIGRQPPELLRGQPGKLVEAEKMEHDALALYRTLEGNENEDVAQALRGLAQILAHENKLVEAENAARDAVAMYLKLFGQENAQVFVAKSYLAEIFAAEGKFAETESLYREGLATCLRVLGPEHLVTSGAYQCLGGLFSLQGRLTEAESFFRNALAIRSKKLGMDSPDTVGTTHCLADVLRREGKLVEAQALIDALPTPAAK